MKETAALRIMDVNLNRAQEGLRVCEEIVRFVFNSKELTKDIKSLRHNLNKTFRKSNLSITSLIHARNTPSDVGKNLDFPSAKRDSIITIFYANSQRTKESLRVLEEFSKLFDNNKISKKIQKLRFSFYAIEKKYIQKLHALSSIR